ncbi:MFS transporter [Paenibacillus spongiae]|uniref:MFS transporter n=1 Tax=Paenibacillus spongiae TaxID=2909671 RepID=A0ABY5SKL3_9BACL|nr:MFS transporter [Paenibacillus spongiae]UVI33123.1 MFS transporter [Paenibacillus spongiae]
MLETNMNWKRNVTLFLVSQTVSLFGSSLVQYAIMWYITINTQSGVMMTISIICGFLPTFFLSPFAGVWADRYNRKKLIMISDSSIALSTLLLAILFLMGYDAIWLLFVVSAIRALGTGIQTPAVSSFLPQLVPGDKLTKVNATYSSIQSLVMLVSPMLSGALLTLASIESIFFIDVITAAIAVLILLFYLKVPAHAKALQKQDLSYFEDMKKGFVYIKDHAYVKTFFIFSAVFMILATPVAFLTPLQVTRSFGNDVWRLTAIEMTFSIGMMAGGIIMASWGGFKNKVHTMVLSSFAIGICTFALGLIPIFWIYLLVMAFSGLTMPFFNTPSTVMLQQKVEESYLGRVFGVFSMIASSMMPLGMLVFGPLADIIRIEWLLIGTGLLMVVQSLFMLGNNVLIKAGAPAPEVEVKP